DHVGERMIDGRQRGLAAGVDQLPREVREFLGSVRLAAGGLQQAYERVVGDRPAGLAEARPDEGGELGRDDRPQLEPLRTSPEGLVANVEDQLQDLPLAPE